MMHEQNNNEEGNEVKTSIIFVYKSVVESKKTLPIYNDFLSSDISREKIRHHFGGIERLHEYMTENYADFLSEHFSNVDSMFADDRKVSSGHSKYIITTAVADSPAHVEFLASLKSYAEINDAKIVVMPCESVTNSFENKKATFDPVFSDKDIMVVTEDTELNNNFSLCSIQVSAKQIKSITGLSRLGSREGSYVFASPKQFLEYVPSGNRRGKNFAIMTPGACTRPHYYSEVFVSKRLSYIADADHKLGAIIVEIIDDQLFDFTQIQAETDGSFIDRGIEYHSDGSTNKVPVNVIFGDIHSRYKDTAALEYFYDLLKDMEVDSIFLHDVFDAYSINHHVKTIAEKAQRSNDLIDSLWDELVLTKQTIQDIDEAVEAKNVFIVKSNHDEFLDRYLAAGEYVFDPKNHYLSLRIAPALFEHKDILKTALELVDGTVPDHWAFLSRESTHRIGGVECAAHGDLGMNGARPSLSSLEKIYGDSVTGHSHTAAIQRGVFKVGTMSLLNLKYNRGPSSWTQTCCLLYNNGQRQLVNYIS